MEVLSCSETLLKSSAVTSKLKKAHVFGQLLAFIIHSTDVY